MNPTNQDFLSEFISLYRQYPCLWKIKCKDYMNKQLKAAAYDALLKKYKEIDENANAEFIKKKINSLRSAFRKECKKVQQSQRSGAGEEDIYTPSLWYYEKLLFLQDQEMPRNSISNIEDEELDIEEVDDTNNTQEDGKNTSMASEAPISVRKRARKDPSTEILGIVAEKLKCPPAQKLFQNYGNHLAEQLRMLPKEQAIHAQKLFNDVLYEASLGNLSRESTVLARTDNPPEFAAHAQQFVNYAAQPYNYASTSGYSANNCRRY